MNKTELVSAVADMYDRSKNDVKEVVDGIIETVQEALAEGEEVAIAGFGTFTVTERAARKGRNPATGEEIDIPASKSPKFKPGKGFKDAVKG